MRRIHSLFFILFMLGMACNWQNSGKKEVARDSSELPSTASFKPSGIQEQICYSRAMEAVNWGMPIVNFDLMYQAMAGAKGTYNQIVFWPKLPDWKNQTLTPNPDVIYIMPFFNTKEAGPMVLEIPPAGEGTIVGSIMDCWQSALEDVGPAGADKGKGGKYLILPPGHKEKVPGGYIPLQSLTYQGYALLRSVLKSGSETDIATAVAYAKRIKLYPLSKTANPPQTVFIDVSGTVFDATIPYDIRFYEALDRMVQQDVWITRDKVMIDLLKSIGIAKGKPFHPDVRTKEILNHAVRDAKTWINLRYEAIFTPPFYEGAHWALPASPEVVEGMGNLFANPDSYPIDGRGMTYSMAFFSSKHLGAGQYYLMTIKDNEGRPLSGNLSYHLRVPANAPVNQYWSATIYDGETHAFIRDVSRSGRSSQSPGLQQNPDGSSDIYFAPEAPEGKEPNWIPTNPERSFEVLFRFYGPEKALFEKTWKLPDIEKLK